LIDELVPYETRTYSIADDVFPPTESDDKLRDSLSALVYDTSIGNNPPLLEKDVFASENFAERSVAATDWSLTLNVDRNGNDFPIHQLDDILLIIDRSSYEWTVVNGCED